MLDTSQSKINTRRSDRDAVSILAEHDATLIKKAKDKSPLAMRHVHRQVKGQPIVADPVITIRDAQDEDAAGLIAVVATVVSEFAGCIFDLDADFPDLKQPRSSFKKDGGRFWVAESESVSPNAIGKGIAGCFGFVPAEDPRGIELQRFYLRSELRGTGLASKMFKIVQAVGRQRSARFIEVWTDSRFTAAQRFYEKLGFIRQPGERLLNDRSRSSEYHYLLMLT